MPGHRSLCTAMQRRHSGLYVLLILLLSCWSRQQLSVLAQDASPSPSPPPADATPSPSPAADAPASPSPSPSPAPSDSSPSPEPTDTAPSPSPTPPADSPPTADDNSGDDASLPPDTTTPEPVSSPATDSSGGATTAPPTAVGTPPTTNSPPPPATAQPPAGSTPPTTGDTGSTTAPGGSTTTPTPVGDVGGTTTPGGSTIPVTGVTPTIPGGTTAPADGNTTSGNTTTPGFVIPTPDETAIDGISASDDECKLMAELYKVMGADADTSRCNSSSSTTAATTQSFSEYQRSSAAYRDGVFKAQDGSSFCISREGAAHMAREDSRASFQSVDDVRELPDIVDPACDDVYADEREGCAGMPFKATFMENEDGSVSNADDGDYTEDTGTPQLQPSPSPDAAIPVSPSPSPGPDLALQNCTRKFLKAGSQPRSVAIILLKWRREYYKSKEQCCEEQGNPPDCDCTWGGRKYDNLLPPKAYSRLFTDECDKGPSLNRAYYDLSGGKITFHSKLRVPVPSGYTLNGDLPTVIIQNASTQASPSPGSDGTVPGDSLPPLPQPSPSPYVVPTEPVETPTSYLDPDGVDVYGWATLDGMRTESGSCRDWCGEAIEQLGVNPNDYNHVSCLQLLASKALCDECKEGNCVNTCPAETGITTGCGCATCYYAWGAQMGCSDPVPPGARTGLGAWSKYYQGEMADLAGGEFVTVEQGVKMFLGHEIGHNMGLTHTGAINCKISDDGKTIQREPQFCKPDWYGDRTSFMGSGTTLQLASAIKYKVNWLPRGTLRKHTPGTERRYVMRPATIRRPSWQNSTRVRWFGGRSETLAVRIPLRTDLLNAPISSYTCPCNPTADEGGAEMCPTCKNGVGEGSPCTNGPCCLDAKCADAGLTWYYVELHMPFRNDYQATYRGLTIRFMGELASTNCTSTRQVPTHVEDGQLKYMLNQADPTGETLGSKFEDLYRGVTVILERWTNTSAVVYVRA